MPRLDDDNNNHGKVPNGRDWVRYKELVLSELKRADRERADLGHRIDRLVTELTAKLDTAAADLAHKRDEIREIDRAEALKTLERIRHDASKLQTEVALLKGKAITFGAAAGFFVTLLIEYLFKSGVRLP